MQNNYRKTNTAMAMRIKRRRERMIKLIMRSFLISIFSFIMISLAKENMELRQELRETIYEKNNIIAELTHTIGDLNNTLQETDKQLRHVASVNESYVDELNTLRNRAELYDKYEYAIIYGGNRTELTYEEIQLGEELMLSKGYDPHLMFGSIMVESNANPNAVNKSSGATGYGQFLDSTARWVWTSLMGNDSYYSDIRKDGKVNILMMATYYDYLYSVTDSTFKVVKCYSGNSTDEGTRRYIARVNKFIGQVGEKLET